MQPFSADATIFLKKMKLFFCPLKTWKNHLQNLLIIGPQYFFQYCQPAQNQPNSHFLFHKNVSLRDFYIITLYIIAEKSHFGKNYSYRAEQSATKFNWRWNTLAIYARLVAPRFTLLDTKQLQAWVCKIEMVYSDLWTKEIQIIPLDP